MRSTVEAAMPSSVTVQRPTYAPDGHGGRVSTYSAVGVFPARVASMSGAPRVFGDARVTEEASHVVYLPHDADVREGDRIVFENLAIEVLHVSVRSWDLVTVVAGRVLA